MGEQREIRSINRVLAASVIVLVVVVAVLSMLWTLGFVRPADDELLPVWLRSTIVFFTFEATRMFVHVMVGAAFYECSASLPAPAYSPLVSVVVPAWNEEVGLAKTIESVLASSYTNTEIIIVDDGSTDMTGTVARRFVDADPSRVFLVGQPNAGKGAALNTGVLHSFGDIIVNVDADSAVEPDAIGNLVRRFASGQVDAVVGRVAIGNTHTFIGRSQAFEYLFGFHLRRAQSVFNTIFILSGAMCAYRRRAFDATEGFRDYSKTEDMDFSLQLRDAGMRLVYADDAVCVTEGAANTSGLRNQRRRWRYGAFSCFTRHRRLFFDRRPGHRSLGFYELPASLLGYVQILLYPAVFAVAFVLPIYTGEYLYFGLVLLSVPVNFAIVMYTAGSLRRDARHLPMMIVLTCTTMAIEHVTMWSALARYLTRRDLAWTNWARQGVDGLGAAVASVIVPPNVVAQLTAGYATDAEIDARLDAEFDAFFVSVGRGSSDRTP